MKSDGSFNFILWPCSKCWEFKFPPLFDDFRKLCCQEIRFCSTTLILLWERLFALFYPVPMFDRWLTTSAVIVHKILYFLCCPDVILTCGRVTQTRDKKSSKALKSHPPNIRMPPPPGSRAPHLRPHHPLSVWNPWASHSSTVPHRQLLECSPK